MRRIEVGFTCNNHCVFCAPGNLRERLPQNPKLASELSEVAEGDRVAFVGGEPTLFDELSSWVRQAKEHGAASVVVQTNARRLAVQGLLEAGQVGFAFRHRSGQLTDGDALCFKQGEKTLKVDGEQFPGLIYPYHIER